MASIVRTGWTRIPAKYPFAFGVGLSCVKTSFSDLLVQKVVERREEIDWKRNAAFAAFGFFYLGGVQYTLYVPVFTRLFPHAAKFAAKPLRAKIRDLKGMAQLAGQVFLDQCVHHPLMYFPAFYITKDLVMSDSFDIGKSLSNCRANLKEDLVALWKIWVPAMIINFSFMPMYARIPFVAGVSLLWTCILSSMRGGDVVHGEEMAGGAVTGATLTMMQEGFVGFFHTSVDLDKDMSHLVLTASGPDKPGWVAMLAASVAKEHGNVTHSKMVRLGNEFIILMHVATPPGQTQSLIKSLQKNPDLKPLNIRCTGLTRRSTGEYSKAVHGLRIHCIGEDRPGMLAAIAAKITEEGMSVENISTEVVMRHNGRRDFVITAECTTTMTWDKDHIRELDKEFSSLKDSLCLDVVDIRVHSA